LAFLDEEQGPAPPPPPAAAERPRRTPVDPQRRRRQFVVRRLIGVGVVLAFLILVVLAFRGCLEARKERGIRNYVTDVNTIMTESQQRGEDFFELLEASGGSSSQEFEDTVREIRGASESLLDRAEDLDVPDEMAGAQDAVVLSLQLRRDALGKIADNTGAATADAETQDALDAIVNQMSSLYSSDVIYTQVGVPEVEQVIEDEGISVTPLRGGHFMPSADLSSPQNLEWLDRTQILDALAALSGGDATSGTHGLGIVPGGVSIGGETLSPDVSNSVSANDREIAVEVQNQGSSEETDVEVVVSIDGEELPHYTIASIQPGETQTARLEITTPPTPGAEVELDVLVTPVAGEEDSSNNEATYGVTFG
jgi:CARDB